MHQWHHRLARHLQASIRRGAQGDVADGTMFGEVDRLAGVHPGDPLRHLLLFGKRQQCRDAVIAEALFRVIEVEPAGFGRITLGARGVVLEPLAQRRRSIGCSQAGQCAPGGAFRQCRHRDRNGSTRKRGPSLLKLGPLKVCLSAGFIGTRRRLLRRPVPEWCSRYA